MITLSDVKKAMGVTGTYNDDQLQPFFDDVVDYIRGAGVSDANITAGIVARGVLDTWNYGAGDGKMSEYFYHRVAQLSYKSL